MSESGNLVVRPMRAKLFYSTEYFGKRMDPFTKVSIGNQLFKTKVAKDQHKSPSWADSFTFRINNQLSIEIEVRDRDILTRHDRIGDTSIPLHVIFRRRVMTGWYDLKKKGKVVGQILIGFEFFPDDAKENLQKTIRASMSPIFEPAKMKELRLSHNMSQQNSLKEQQENSNLISHKAFLVQGQVTPVHQHGEISHGYTRPDNQYPNLQHQVFKSQQFTQSHSTIGSPQLFYSSYQQFRY